MSAQQRTEVIVIAAGAWSARCAEWLGVPLPVSPLRGQILALRQPDVPLRHILKCYAPLASSDLCESPSLLPLILPVDQKRTLLYHLIMT